MRTQGPCATRPVEAPLEPDRASSERSRGWRVSQETTTGARYADAGLAHAEQLADPGDPRDRACGGGIRLRATLRPGIKPTGHSQGRAIHWASDPREFGE